MCDGGLGEVHGVCRSLGGGERWLSPQRQALTVFQVSLQLRESEVTDQVFLKVAGFPLWQATPTADGWAPRRSIRKIP